MTDSYKNQDRNVEATYGAGFSALANSLKFAFGLLLFLIVGIILWYLSFGGYFTVNPQETVLLLKFGKIVKPYQDGWHWAFPYPVHSIVRIPTSQQTIVTESFWHSTDISIFANPEEEVTGGPLKPGKDGYLLSGDANIIHTQWTMIYRIINAEKFFIRCRSPEDSRKEDDDLLHPETGKELGTRGAKTQLRSLLENCILKEVAVQEVDQALYKDSNNFRRNVEETMKKLVIKRNLGVEVLNVELTAKTPPLNTIRSFQKVIEAELDSNTEQQKARKYATKTLGEAKARKAQIEAEAEAYQQNIEADIIADNITFKKILAEYRKNPETVLVALYTDMLKDVLPKVKEKYIIRVNKDGKQEVRLMINPEPRYQRESKEKPSHFNHDD